MSTAFLLGGAALVGTVTATDAVLHAQAPRRTERATPRPNALPPLTPMMGRVLVGDYTWSTAFPTEEADLLGYTTFFVKAIRRSCVDFYPPSVEEDLFTAGWIHNGVQADLAGMVLAAANMRAIEPEAEEDAAALLGHLGCDGPRLQHFMANAARLLSGRRPVHGPFTKRGNLVDETTAPLGGRHLFSLDGLQSSGLAMLDAQANDLAARGFRILECRYDRVPGDEHWHVQYYWTGAPPKILTSLSFMPAFSLAMQRQLQRANGAPLARHPYKDFGSPRTECPAAFDSALRAKEIYAPRGEVAGLSEATAVGEPKMSELPRGDRTYAYGPAPEAFVPPIPPLAGPSVTITMEKVRAGSLARIKVGSAAGAWMQLTRGGWQDWLRRRAADAALVSEDLQAISPITPQPLTSRPRRRGERSGPEDARRAAPPSPTPAASPAATPANPVLTCEYLDEQQGTLTVVHFWYRERPALAAPDRLRTRVKDHPLLLVRSPRDTCPARYADATLNQ